MAKAVQTAAMAATMPEALSQNIALSSRDDMPAVYVAACDHSCMIEGCQWSD